MQDEFLRLQKLLHKTIVFITHDFLEALRLADRIVIMKDGRVVQMGTPADLVLRPADDYVAEFTKDVPRVRVITAGEIMESGGDGLDTANGVAPETTLEDLMPRMANHPEGLAILSDGGAVVGQVTPQDIVRALAAADADAEAS
jgi:glycine betaine/proline transport system ATP-binding protein